MSRRVCRIVHEPIRGAELERDLRSDADGAIAAFYGVVRDQHRGRGVHHLEYHGYERMAEEELERIAGDLETRHAVSALGLIHRVGRLDVGEVSVAVVATAAHRAEALACCAGAIEEIKRRLPIWKKEFFTDGGNPAWVFGPDETCEAAHA